VGVVRQKTAEFYLLDILGKSEGILGICDFEGATKKNRPMLKVFDTKANIYFCM